MKLPRPQESDDWELTTRGRHLQAAPVGQPESADLHHYARAFSEALDRTIGYRSVPISAWSEKIRQVGLPEHVIKHLTVLAELHQQGRFDRLTDDVLKLTGQKPIGMREFVKEHAAESTRS